MPQLKKIANILAAMPNAPAEPEKPKIRWKTGFNTLDKQLGGGLRPGDLMFVYGPPRCGRTSFLYRILDTQREINKWKPIEWPKRMEQSCEILKLYTDNDHLCWSFQERAIPSEDEMEKMYQSCHRQKLAMVVSAQVGIEEKNKYMAEPGGPKNSYDLSHYSKHCSVVIQLRHYAENSSSANIQKNRHNEPQNFKINFNMLWGAFEL